MKVVLKNDYHRTTITLYARGTFLSPLQAEKSRKTLCGKPNCDCTNIFGMRGTQDYFIQMNPDGSAWIRTVPASAKYWDVTTF